MLDTKCAATMCPLIAPNGSPWTGNKNRNCQGKECGFYHNNNKCEGRIAAAMQVQDVLTEGSTFQLALGKYHDRKPMQFDCPKADECQWQKESGENLCPPRLALSKGKDPRICLF